ncbi:hypothetical protein Y032_0514g2773 [Ancylostoma ceylanicum]|uniref:Uncharacterized protein n=1 Tax=Ancylostoma ceylanicum TaxID=53326 RepID=A0A016WTD3_9BILA|nr:hypothetical protein Y032_0514g2773 [Ancylostoma ceylanicum]
MISRLYHALDPGLGRCTTVSSADRSASAISILVECVQRARKCHRRTEADIIYQKVLERTFQIYNHSTRTRALDGRVCQPLWHRRLYSTDGWFYDIACYLFSLLRFCDHPSWRGLN